ncbi:MAG: 16S rRNA (cytosine(1402)-N(4))-methyltransferase RsmH [Bacillota bacterium]|nr:16S rRNA (cytosine(1402)-N(4))-methyltransferase RsmH [Bacillota bacterium]
MEYYHLPVMPEECLRYLDCKKGATYVDGTVGGGGHTELMLRRTSPGGRVIGIDLDEKAIAATQARNAGFGERLLLAHSNYAEIKSVLRRFGIEKVEGILLDLGVSSSQLDDPERGFSYQQDAPLDMRMDTAQPLDARKVVNTYSREALIKVISGYGEERYARRIADQILWAREKKTIETTGELVELIKRAIPAPARRTGPHPAKRTFQAIRIEVNAELENLQKAVFEAADVLKSGGRLVVITFQSLEDRIVKRAFLQLEDPCTCPPKAPVCTCGKKGTVRVLTKKPVIPSEDEIKQNPRSRSAKLRAIERI